MKILSKSFIKKFSGKIVNKHPSLLPKYKGLDTHFKAIQNKDKVAGCTVHFVTAKLDSGKIILQKKVKISKKDTSSMIIIHTYLNGEFLNSYWADGLIIATPTGSTGYSLSCGGPIIFPSSENFVITPISPHNLNVRPIIISDNQVITFEVEGRSAQFLATLDARTETIESTVQLAVRKAAFQINLIRLHSENYLGTLRNKLMWGLDTRN